MSSAWPRTKQFLCWCCPKLSERHGQHQERSIRAGIRRCLEPGWLLRTSHPTEYLHLPGCSFALRLGGITLGSQRRRELLGAPSLALPGVLPALPAHRAQEPGASGL